MSLSNIFSYVELGDVDILGDFIHQMIYLKSEVFIVPQIELIVVLGYPNFMYFWVQNAIILRYSVTKKVTFSENVLCIQTLQLKSNLLFRWLEAERGRIFKENALNQNLSFH